MKKKTETTILRYNAVFEPCEEGGFTVTAPKLPGLVTEGDTYEKALTNAKDAISGYLQILSEAGEPIPDTDAHTFTSPVSITYQPTRFASY